MHAFALDLPPVMRPARRLVLALVAAVVLAGILVNGTLLAFAITGSTAAWLEELLRLGPLVPAALLVGALVAWLHQRRQHRAVTALVRDADLLVCGVCGHDLHGAPAEACPECGTAFHVLPLQSYWRRLLRRGAWWDYPAPRATRKRMPPLLDPFFAAILLLGIPVAGLMLGNVTLLLLGTVYWYVTVLPVTLALAYALAGRRRRHMVRRMFRFDLALCDRCATLLPPDRERGACTSCGDRYELTEVRRRWMERGPCHWHEEMEARSGCEVRAENGGIEIGD